MEPEDVPDAVDAADASDIADTVPPELSREEYLVLLAGLREGLQREVDEVEELAERLRAVGGEGCPQDAALLDGLVENRLAPALQRVCAIEEGAFRRSWP